jgi:hypothetical protein
MKILIDATNIGSGGTIKNLLNLIKFNNSRYNCLFIYHTGKLKKKIKQSKKIKLFEIKFSNFFYRLFWQICLIDREYDKLKCNLVYAPGGYYLGKKKSVICNQNIVPFSKIAIDKILNFNFFIKMKILKFIHIYSMKKAEGVIFLTLNSLNIISKYVNIKKKIVIPNGIEKDFFLKKNKYSNIVITSIADDLPYKNYDTLYKAINKISLKKNIKLNIVGKIKKDKKLLNPKVDLSLYERLNKKKIINILKKTKIFLFLSSLESFPITLLEAMASRNIIICSNLKPMNQILDKNCCFFINPKSSIELEKKLFHIINSKNSFNKFIDNAVAKSKSKSYNLENISRSHFNFFSLCRDK